MWKHINKVVKNYLIYTKICVLRVCTVFLFFPTTLRVLKPPIWFQVLSRLESLDCLSWSGGWLCYYKIQHGSAYHMKPLFCALAHPSTPSSTTFPVVLCTKWIKPFQNLPHFFTSVVPSAWSSSAWFTSQCGHLAPLFRTHDLLVYVYRKNRQGTVAVFCNSFCTSWIVQAWNLL